MNVNDEHKPTVNKVADASKSATRIVLTGDLSDGLLAMLRSAGLLRHSDDQDLTSAFKDIRLTSGEQAEIYVELDWERAISAVHEYYDLKLRVKEPEAGSTMLSSHEAPSHSQRLLELRDELETATKDSQCKESENEILLLQLHHIQEELETYYNKNQELENTIAALRDSTPKELETYYNKNQELENTVAVLRDSAPKELKTYSKELETYYNKNQELENTIAALRDSTSWKLTARLRRFVNKFPVCRSTAQRLVGNAKRSKST